ncbi:aldo/keto reductase [candidate division KSB3 bacterium]|uniref:Aldo/keto reductase n=1 Tax=candidate division KSB3 bacterium TaxID=2044937 RepID=A0A9D5Q6C9_9BACT|nr:aldo/keto reductase [candidate division KSB3 bacterium]MBD3324796.1 aldo/keto reductase [candidate division KSB3 bacterium]
MEYRRLGRSGVNVSPLVVGTMNFGNPTPKDEAVRIIDAALDAGINVFDCADVYAGGESERILGEAFQRNGKRREVLLTSKVFNKVGQGPNDFGNSRHHILDACEQSLRRLQTDHIDIYFLHRTDFRLPQEETLAALDLLVKQGKVRYIACSTHPAWRIVEALLLAEKSGYPKFICEQPPYNLLDRRIENEIIPMCQTYDLGILSWSPLAHGVLAGRYTDASKLPEGSRGTRRTVYADRITQAGIEVSTRLAERAEHKGCTVAQLAVAWVLHQPGITATILGPRTLEQFESLLPALEIVLDEEDLAFCDALVPPGQAVANFFNTSRWMKS